MNKEKFSKDIKDKVEQLRRMKKVAKQVTLTEFIEQYPLHQHIILGAMWYGVNQNKINNNFAEELNVSYGGTSPD